MRIVLRRDLTAGGRGVTLLAAGSQREGSRKLLRLARLKEITMVLWSDPGQI